MSGRNVKGACVPAADRFVQHRVNLNMHDVRVPQVSKETIKRIKEIVEYHHGFTPRDDDICRIDDMLRDQYAVLQPHRIVRELVMREIDKDLLTHRDRLGSLEFERIWLEKTIFKYLTFASMSYRAGIPAATISLCRTAIESGLRERLAEELAEKGSTSSSELAEAVCSKLKELERKTLAGVIRVASEEGIIGKQEVGAAFQELRFKHQTARKILDKFIHGDIVWIVDFVRHREEDTSVVGAKDLLQEYKLISDMKTDEIAVEVLKATYEIAGILYFGDA